MRAPIQFEHVWKRYNIHQEGQEGVDKAALRRLWHRLSQPARQFCALQDVCFEVQPAQTLGIIGPNGAGKSTILKLLSHITTPTSGRIIINGTLSALIEVGSGFHPELTGRENIYLTGAILGMRRREITSKLDSIIDFAGVSEFIDTPVKRYSSGMYVRLGFSIAAHLQADVLLLDEVLAVGDAAFQAKCFQRVSELQKNGVTIVFVSHDLTSVEMICDRVLLLNRGRIEMAGEAHEVTTTYQRLYGSVLPPPPPSEMEAESKGIQITSVTFRNGDGRSGSAFRTGNPLEVCLTFDVHRPVEDVIFQVFYYSADGRFHCQYTTAVEGQPINLETGTGMVTFISAELGLQPGIYYADATVKRRGASEDIDWLYRCATLRIDPGKIVAGKFYTPHEWHLVQGNSHVLTRAG